MKDGVAFCSVRSSTTSCPQIHNPNNAAYQMNMSYGQYPPMPNYMGTSQYSQYQQAQPAGQMYSQNQSAQPPQQQYNMGQNQYWQSPSGPSKGIDKK
jgi:hypothetical protein